MLQLAERPVRTEPGGLPFAHREAYPAYFARLASHRDARAALRRLITHLDADLDGDERLALWQALWRVSQCLSPADRRAVATCLDGRHAAALAPLDRPWNDPALIEHLAASTQPAAAQAVFVPALLAHHGLDPLAQPRSHDPALVLLAARAALHDSAPRRDAACITGLQAAALAAVEAEPSLLPQGLALLFELALQAADEGTATAVLAELLRHGQARVLRADRVRAWLDGTAFTDDPDTARPLLLAPALQAHWLQPARWLQPAARQALRHTLQRPAVRARLDELGRQCGDADGAAAVPVAAGDTLKALQALDSAWSLVDQGGDAVPAVRPMMSTDVLAGPTLAALWRASARCNAATGDVEGQALALAQARRHAGGPQLRAALAALLPRPVPALSADWRDEWPYWLQLQHHEDPRWQRLARFQLATLYTDGLLEPRPPRQCQDLARAHGLWTALAAESRYAALATRALRQPAQTLLRPVLRQHEGSDYLWIDCPGAQAVTVVFSCIATHHTFAEVGTLRGRLPGQHLMFVRCPDKNWYCDDAWDRVHALLRDRVQSRFAPDQVTCWYGSMGGHGALKAALAFGWRAIVFNPQTDLDLWAAFRPRERALLWAAERQARLTELPLASWERAPLYLACGAATADREALSVVIAQLRRCRHASAIIEKFDDTNHAGLMNRIAGGAVAPVLARITQRLQHVAGTAPAAGAQVLDGDAAQAAFWDRLDAARALKVEVQLRDGRLWWQPSQACGTRP